MVCDRNACFLKCVRFCPSARRNARLDSAPVIKDPWNVSYLLRRDPLDHTQSKIVVLTSLKPDTKSADLPQKLRSIARKMRYHIERKHQIVRKVGLELRVRAVSLRVDDIFVAEDHPCIGKLVQFGSYEIECVLGEFVVVIEQNAKLSRRQLKCRIRSSGNVAVLFAENDLYARFGGCELFEKGANVRLCRCVVGDAEFPIRIDLSPNRIDTSFEPDLVYIVNGQNHGDLRFLLKCLDLIPHFLALCIVQKFACNKSFVGSRIPLFARKGSENGGKSGHTGLSESGSYSSEFFPAVAHLFWRCISQPSGLIGIVTISSCFALLNSRACAGKSRSLNLGCFQSATNPQIIKRAGKIKR